MSKWLEEQLNGKISMRELYRALASMDGRLDYRNQPHKDVGRAAAQFLLGYNHCMPKEDTTELEDYLDNLWKG